MSLVKIEGFELEVAEDGEPRVRDVDLGQRLGYERPETIRDLIKRMIAAGEFEVPPRRTVRKNAESFGKGRPAGESWLTEEEALLVCMRSDAPNAIPIRRMIVKVFRAALRQAEASHAQERGLWQRIQSFLLAPKPSEWERMFQDSLVRELCRLDGIVWAGGSHPRHLASTNRKIYDTVFSTATGRALKALNPEPRQDSNHHQHLTSEAREYFAVQLRTVEVVARQSETKADFWARMDREYGGGMLQMPMHLDTKQLS